jgi:hypothetical protein
MGRWTLVVLLALAGCKDDAPSKAAAPPGPAPAPPAPELTRAIVVAECALFVRAAARFLACPAAEPHHQTFRELRDRFQTEPLEPPNGPEAYVEHCLHALVRLDTRADVAGCDVGLSAAEKTTIAKRRLRRTAPPDAGTKGLRDYLQKLAGDRDRACACPDDACASSAGTIKREDLHPDRRSPPVRAAHDAILGELGDCKLFEEFRDPPR